MSEHPNALPGTTQFVLAQLAAFTDGRWRLETPHRVSSDSGAVIDTVGTRHLLFRFHGSDDDPLLIDLGDRDSLLDVGHLLLPPLHGNPDKPHVIREMWEARWNAPNRAVEELFTSLGAATVWRKAVALMDASWGEARVTVEGVSYLIEWSQETARRPDLSLLLGAPQMGELTITDWDSGDEERKEFTLAQKQVAPSAREVFYEYRRLGWITPSGDGNEYRLISDPEAKHPAFYWGRVDYYQTVMANNPARGEYIPENASGVVGSELIVAAHRAGHQLFLQHHRERVAEKKERENTDGGE